MDNHSLEVWFLGEVNQTEKIQFFQCLGVTHNNLAYFQNLTKITLKGHILNVNDLVVHSVKNYFFLDNLNDRNHKSIHI